MIRDERPARPPLDVCITADVEPDCPPYLWTWRGIEEGMPRLLDLLAGEGVRATLFTTSRVAERYAGIVQRSVGDGHELGCHGVSHTAFTTMHECEANAEITASAAVLREFAPVRSFRAPYLQFPDAFLPLLEHAGFDIDSSQAKYKASYYRKHAATRLTRIPASVTSSVLRLPRVIREAYLGALSSPVVLFVHPWEFVDWRHTTLRWDCRFRTGDIALRCVRSAIHFFKARGARLLPISELPVARTPGRAL